MDCLYATEWYFRHMHNIRTWPAKHDEQPQSSTGSALSYFFFMATQDIAGVTSLVQAVVSLVTHGLLGNGDYLAGIQGSVIRIVEGCRRPFLQG